MERIEPTFVPEWYKGSNSSATGSGNLNHQSGSSSQSDEHNTGFSSRNRLAVSIGDHNPSRLSSFSERTSSSFWRSASSNGYIEREKDSSSRAYNGFGRSLRDWDRNREKDLEIHRERSLLPDNVYRDCPDVLIPSKSIKDSPRRSQSFLLGRRSDPWLKRAVHDSGNVVQSVGSRINGINKTSFEREFPSLSAGEKHVGADIPRVFSPGLSTAIHNLPLTASTIIGGDGWTSALAEVPSILGESSLIASSSPAGLNMAETVAQAPVRACTAPQLPGDSQKIEELHRQQILKLRPMTPSMPKNLGLNPAEKSKTKGAKLPEHSSVKLGQHSSSQSVNHTFRSNIRSDVSKTSQPGNFQVLNREKNGESLDKDNSRSRTVPLLNGQVNPKFLNLDEKSMNSFGEKKLAPQSQNRNDFFNSLRKKTSSSIRENNNDDPRCMTSVPNSEKSEDTSEKIKDASSLSEISQCSAESLSSFEICEVVEEPAGLVPDEEEEAFLRSLGWEDNVMEEALTPEEIESFLSEYEKKMSASKLKIAGCLTRLSSSSDTEVEEASFC